MHIPGELKCLVHEVGFSTDMELIKHIKENRCYQQVDFWNPYGVIRSKSKNGFILRSTI